MKKERTATLLLLLASFLWGLTFVFQNKAASVIGAGLFNGIRMLLGFFFLLPLLIQKTRKHKHDKQYIKKLFLGGFILGLLIALASYVQQVGIGNTSAGKAGFLTSLYSLFVPILATIMGRPTNKKTWICVSIGLCGAFLLSVNEQFRISSGDALMFVCAIIFAVHIIIIDILGKDLEGVDLSALQFFFGGLFSFMMGLFNRETVSLEVIKLAIVPILYAGIFSCGIAYTLQIIGQKYVHPTKATLVLSLESAWAAVCGAILLKEVMSLKEMLGCVLLFSAVIISQLPIGVKKQKKGK